MIFDLRVAFRKTIWRRDALYHPLRVFSGISVLFYTRQTWGRALLGEWNPEVRTVGALDRNADVMHMDLGGSSAA